MNNIDSIKDTMDINNKQYNIQETRTLLLYYFPAITGTIKFILPLKATRKRRL
jgi:hypothetical protein